MAKKLPDLSSPHRVPRGGSFRLADVDPADTGPFDPGDKEAMKAALAVAAERLGELQDRLYAQDTWSVLLVLQAMDTAGKDGVIEHVMSAVDPQGCDVQTFKAPTSAELDHDFLWRCARVLPERGRIGIFNRSYYEEVLIVRVHPEFLDGQKLPRGLVTKRLWRGRYESINDFELHLARSGTLVLKFFLHVSKEEQARRLLARLEDPAKRWKFSLQDLKERERWDDYMAAYEAMVRATSTDHAPWHVVPADSKWYSRAVVASAVVKALAGLRLEFPRIPPARLGELEIVRRTLAAEVDGRRRARPRRRR